VGVSRQREYVQTRHEPNSIYMICIYMVSHFKTIPREYLVRGAANPKIIKVVGFVEG